MAKVYSWQVSKSREYAYIVHPDYIGDDELEVYIGNELTGNNLQKVIDWTSNCTNEEYIQQFDKLKQKCINENYNVVFENVEVYMNVFSTCDNLRGPAGRGISLIKTIDIDPITNISTIAIYYDDNTYDTFEVKNGSDGKDGKDGKDGTNGYDGVSSKFIMVYGTGIQETEGGNIIPPNRPEGGKYNFITNELEFDENETDLALQGWYRNDNLEGVIYMSSRTFTTSESSTDKEWTTPVRISGDQGEPGQDGNSIEFIFNLKQNEPDVTYLDSPNENNFVPDVDGWTSSPTGVDENNTKEWCSIRTYDSEISKWGAWQKATIWSNYGVNGQDGDGIQYIYYRTETADPPKNPTPKDYENNQKYQNINGEWMPFDNYSYVNINNEIVNFTEMWTDNPKGINEKKQYEWVTVRKYRTNNNTNKSWSAFSNPSLWSKYVNKAQIIYPMGIYNENESYTTTDKKAPYVIDTQDGQYYVLNKVMTWKGTEQNGITPSQNYVDNPNDPTWEKFESFNALYTSVGIIENGTVGSAVFNGDYMFSQQGIDKSGNINSNYENFNSVEPYNSNNDFRPNICINFKTGEMWASQGNINFSNGDINLSGYIKKNKTIITPENIGYYTITGLTESTETRGVSTPTPTGVTTGVTATPFVGDTYLDVNKIGSYVVFEGVFTKDIYLAIHSIPGSIDYNSSNYDDARSLIGNYIYIINKSNVTVTINTCCREFNTDENIELRDVPIASNNVILFQCFATLQYRRERIYWEYEGGYIQDNILANEQFIYNKCIDGVPSNPCS